MLIHLYRPHGQVCIQERNSGDRWQEHFLGKAVQGDIMSKEWWPKAKRMFPQWCCETLGTRARGHEWCLVAGRRGCLSLFWLFLLRTAQRYFCSLRLGCWEHVESTPWNTHDSFQGRQSREASPSLTLLSEKQNKRGRSGTMPSGIFWFLEFIPRQTTLWG